MLRTNFSASGRDLYDNGDLNNLVILPFIAQNLGRTPFGVFRMSMTIRFAGRINPDSPTADAALIRKLVGDLQIGDQPTLGSVKQRKSEASSQQS